MVKTYLQSGELVDGRYKVIGELDRGAMGVVYRADHVQLKRQVALKVLALTKDVDRARFEREAAVLARLSHPNIVQCFDLGQLPNGDPYLVMELLQGVLLSKERDESRFGLRRATRLMVQLLDGLTAAHAKGLVHRDLKPSNLFLGVDNNRETLKILDFGLAKPIDDAELDLTRQGVVLGTPAYLPPEAILEEVSPAGDVYACGLIMLELVLGRAVFPESKSALGAVYAGMTCPVEVPERITHTTYGKVLIQALARHPDDRPTAEQMHALLEAAADDDMRLRNDEIPPAPGKGDLQLAAHVIEAGRDALRQLPKPVPYFAVAQFDPQATAPFEARKAREQAGELDEPEVPETLQMSPPAEQRRFIGVPKMKPLDLEVAYDPAEVRRTESAARASNVSLPQRRRKIRRVGAGRSVLVVLAAVVLVAGSIWWFDIDVRKFPDKVEDTIASIKTHLNNAKKSEKEGKVKKKKLSMPDF